MVTIIVLNNAFYVTAAILVALSFHLHLHQNGKGESPLWAGPDVNAALNLNAGATIAFVLARMFSRNRRSVGAERPVVREYWAFYRLSGEGDWSSGRPPPIMSDDQLIPAMSRGRWTGYRGVSQSRLKLLSQIPPMAKRPWRRDAGG